MGRGLTLSSVAGLSAMATLAIALPSWARPASLYATTPSAMINLRTRPTVDSTAIYLARPGDAVEVIEQAQGSDGNRWFFVDLDDNISGWVRGDLVSFDVLVDSPTAALPANIQEVCLNRAFVELDTFRSDIEITTVQITGANSYVLTWRQISQDRVGQCTVNPQGEIVAFIADPLQTGTDLNESSDESSNEEPSEAIAPQPQTTLHNFRTESYAVRVFRVDGESPSRPYINLWNIDEQAFVLQNYPMQVERVRDVTVYWLEADGQDYQVRIVPNQPYVFKINSPTAVVYEGTALSN